MNGNGQVIQIPIEDLVPNRFQPRISFDEKALNDLANSIKQHGIIQPLVVRRLGDKYEIIAGERRYKAAQIAGLVSVPGIIANVNDQSSAEMALVENVQRQDLSAIEEAKSYKNILDAGEMTQDDLAKKMGLSQSSVANKLRLLNLSEEAQQALQEGKISERHARSLLTVEDKAKQVDLLNRVLDERLTVRQLDEIIKNGNNPTRDDIVDDVPLVNIDGNLEEMKRQATDINPTSSSHIDDNGNKFFKYESDDEVNVFESNEVNNMGRPQLMPQEANPTVANPNNTSFASNVENTFPEVAPTTPEQPEEELEMLDVDPNPAPSNASGQEGVTIFDEHSSKSVEYVALVRDIKAYAQVLNVDKNIELSEQDLNDVYRITIDIKKGS